MRSGVRRLLWIALGTIAALPILAAAAIVVLTRTSTGREWLRQLALDVISERVVGSAYLGSLRIGSACSVGLDSAALFDSSGELLLATGAVRARCDVLSLLHRRPVIREVRVEHPHLAIRREPDGSWNWVGAFRQDSGESAPDGGFSLLIDSISIRNGSISIEIPGTSPDSRLGVDAHGRVRAGGGAVEFDVSHLAVGSSSGTVSGTIGRDHFHGTRLDIRASIDRLAFADVAWAIPTLPRDGVARARLVLWAEADPHVTCLAVRELDVQSGGSRVLGTARLRRSEHITTVENVSLSFDPLAIELLRRLSGGALPRTVRGEVRAHVYAPGGPLDDFRVDSAEVAFRDATLHGTESRIVTRGTLDVSDPSRPRFRGFTVALRHLDVRTLARFATHAPELGGALSGGLTLDSALDKLRVSGADLTYRGEGSEPLRLLGDAQLHLGARSRVEVDMHAQPLSFAALSTAIPALSGIPSMVGDLHAAGTIDDAKLIAALAGPGGEVRMDVRVGLRPRLVLAGTGTLRRLDLHRAFGRSGLPPSDLDIDLAVDVARDSMAALNGTISAALSRGSIAQLPIRPSRALLRLDHRRVYVDTLVLAARAGELHTSGALGLAGDVRDTLRVSLATDSLGALLRQLPRSYSESHEISDAPRGHVVLEVAVVGAFDSLDAAGSLEATALRAGSAGAARARLDFALTDLPAASHGSVEVRIDSMGAGPVRARRVEASARAATPRSWRFELRTHEEERPALAFAGSIDLDSATTTVSVSSLDLRTRSETIQLVCPGSVRIAGSSLVFDTLELRGSGGTRLWLRGAYSDKGPVDLTAAAGSVPVPITAAIINDSATRDSQSPGAYAELFARLTGTSAAPLLEARGALRAAAGAQLPLDSVTVSVSYHDRRGTMKLFSAAHGRRVLAADIVLPMVFAPSPRRLAILDAPLGGRITLDSTALVDLLALAPAVRATSGIASADIALGGTGRHPRFDGHLGLRDGAITVPATGTRIQAATADVQLHDDSVIVSRISAAGPGAHAGEVVLDGVIELADVRDPGFDLRFHSSTMPLLSTRQLANLAVSSRLRLHGEGGAPTLSGTITVDRAVVRLPAMGARTVADESDPEFARLQDSVMARHPEQRPSPFASFTRNLRLDDVRIAMGPEVWLRSSEMNVKLGGAIDLTHAQDAASADTTDGEAEGLALHGSLNVQRGTFRLDLGVVQRTFTLEEGSLTFDGEPELNPRLGLNAIHEIAGAQGGQQDVRVRVRLGGTLRHPTLTLSDAGTGIVSLTEEQLLSYLVSGQSSVDVGSGETYRNMLASEVATRLTSAAAEKLMGGFFDIVSVSSGSADGTRGDDGARASISLARSRLELGKQISERTFLTLNAGMCSLLGSSGSDAAGLSESIGMSIEERFRPDLGLTLSSAPATDALYCAQGGVSRGAVPTPRQLGLDLFKTWRF